MPARNVTKVPINTYQVQASGVANTAYCVDNGVDHNCFCSEFGACAWKSIAGGTGAKIVCKTGTGDVSCAALP